MHSTPLTICNILMLMIISTMSVLPLFSITFAQYSGSAEGGSATLEEQLELAKSKITNAQQQGAYGSGTAMFGTNLSDSMLYLIIMIVIFGSASAVFFTTGTRKYKSSGLTNNSDFVTRSTTTNGDKKYNEYAQEIRELKRNVEDLQRRLIKVN